MSSYASYQFRAVRLLMSGPKNYRLVRSVDEAAEVLVAHWPSEDGEEYLGALVACLDALREAIPAIAVREALIRAADEVRIPHMSVVEAFSRELMATDTVSRSTGLTR